MTSKIKIRHCPSCRTELKRFYFTGLLFPVEDQAAAWHAATSQANLAAGLNYNPPFIPFRFVLKDSWLALGLAGPCSQCGHVSLWNIPGEEMEELLKPPNEHQIAINWTYQPEKLQQLADTAQESEIKETALRLIELINKNAARNTTDE